MKKLDRILDVYETGAFVVLLSLMTVVVFFQVIFRYVIHSSIPWSEEVSRYCMVYVTFIGVGAGIKAGTHTGVDAFVSFMPEKIKKAVMFIEKILVLIISVVFFKYSLELVIQLFENGQKSATLFIPIAFAYISMPLGFLGGIIRSAQNLIKFIKPDADIFS